MRPTDPVEPAVFDHCLVHQFIRTHGRRPTGEELRALQERADVVPPVVIRPRASASAGLSGVRRELSKLVNRR